MLRTRSLLRYRAVFGTVSAREANTWLAGRPINKRLGKVRIIGEDDLEAPERQFLLCDQNDIVWRVSVHAFQALAPLTEFSLYHEEKRPALAPQQWFSDEEMEAADEYVDIDPNGEHFHEID
eukprot:TRINITY_DN68188_c10_g9_i1.p1 TRINITY_DN68188_c10_g9~~TRINITY_DN68188_c10_g9_i1.p1  ORF type:complete len:122 (+),score=7.74 TRINITY_DN68188_c10_g9_i1:27-392(+)